MLTNKIFNASALGSYASINLCFLSKIPMLTIKSIFAYGQMSICLLSNVISV